MGSGNLRRITSVLAVASAIWVTTEARAACPASGSDCTAGGQTINCTKGCERWTYICAPECSTCSRVWKGGKSGNATAGTVCGSGCLGACDGNGVCDNATLWPIGTACGDGTVSECTDKDSCDATGACQANDEPDGKTCIGGTCLTGECVNPDAGSPDDAGASGGAAGSAGASGSGGSVASGGSGASGGMTASGGAKTGGAGGATNTGGGASGGTPSGTGGTNTSSDGGDDGGCGCRVRGTSEHGRSLGAITLLATCVMLRRMRRDDDRSD